MKTWNLLITYIVRLSVHMWSKNFKMKFHFPFVILHSKIKHVFNIYLAFP